MVRTRMFPWVSGWSGAPSNGAESDLSPFVAVFWENTMVNFRPIGCNRRMMRGMHPQPTSSDVPQTGQAVLCGLRTLALLALMPLFLLGCGGGSDATDRANPAATGELRSKAVKAASAASTTPETGWYWNPAEGGTGFMFEAQGNRAFVGFFMYEEGTGAPIWYVASGDVTTEAGAPVFTGDLRLHTISLGAAPSTSVGTVRVVFDGRNATASLPGGRTMPATRFDIAGGGHDFDRAAPITREQPEAGWYWDPARPGSGYAIEVQNGRMFLGIFEYSPFGRPTWSIVDTPLEAGIAAAATTRYADGQTLTSAHRSPYSNLTGLATLTFANSCTGRIQRDLFPTIYIRRFRVDDSPLPPGAECREGALGHLAAPGGSTKDAMRLRLGETVEAELRTPGEVHVYAMVFPHDGVIEPRTYRIDLQAAASGQGSLASPLLSVHGPDGKNWPFNQEDSYPMDDPSGTLRCRADRQGGCNTVFSPSALSSGVYYIAVRAADRGTGTYRLVTYDDGEWNRQSQRQYVGKTAGRYVGRVTGRLGGSLDILVDGNGTAHGTWAKAASAGASPERVPLTGVMNSEYLGLAGPAGRADLYLVGVVTPVDGVFTGFWQDSNGPGGVFATTSERVAQEVLQFVRGPSKVQAGMAEHYRVEHLDLQRRGIAEMRFLPEQYRWRVLSSPEGSRAQLFSPQGHSNWFTADLPGTYMLEMRLSEMNGRVTTSYRDVTAFAPPALAFYDPATNPVSLAFVAPTGQDKLTELDTDVPVSVQLLLNGAASNSDRTDHQTITLSSDNPAIRVLGGPMRLIWPSTDGRAVFALRSCTGGSAQLTAVSTGRRGSAHTLPIQMRVEVPPSRATC